MLFLLRLTATTTARWRAKPAPTSVSAPVLVWSESFFINMFSVQETSWSIFQVGVGSRWGVQNKNRGVILGRGSGAQLTFPAKWADLLPSLAGCSAGSLLQSIFCFPWETRCNSTLPTSRRARVGERDASFPFSTLVFLDTLSVDFIAKFGQLTSFEWKPPIGKG